MAASQTPLLRASFTKLASSWPIDPIRSDALQFSSALTAASQRIFETASSPGGTAAGVEAIDVILKGEDLLNAARSVDALERLLDGSAKRAFPITNTTLKPASYPNHYTVLQEGIDRAKRGESLERGWFSWIRWQRQ